MGIARRGDVVKRRRSRLPRTCRSAAPPRPPPCQASYTIVVAHYTESMTWLNYMKPDHLVVYHKGGEAPDAMVPSSSAVPVIPRPNVGREGETFLHHIIEHYDNLPDYLLLVQGDPFDHMYNVKPHTFQQKIDALVKRGVTDAEPLFTGVWRERHDKYSGMNFHAYFNLIFDGEEFPAPSSASFASGSQYIVPRDTILHRPKEFYTRLRDMLCRSTVDYADVHDDDADAPFEPSTIHGWALERLFMYMLRRDVPVNDAFMPRSFNIDCACAESSLQDYEIVHGGNVIL